MAGSAAAQDTTAPTPGTATLATSQITIPFNEQLKSDSVPATSAFAATINTISVNVAQVSIDDVTSGGVTTSEVVVGLAVAPNPSENVNVTYTAPTTNPLQDSSSNKVAGFSKTGLNTSTTWSTVAVSTATATSSNTVKLVFDGNMTFHSGTVFKRFTVSSDGTDRIPTSLRRSGLATYWLGGISPPLVKGKTITVAYDQQFTTALASASRLKDGTAKPLKSFSKAVTNQVAESISSAVIVGQTLTLTYTGTLGTSQVPLINDYVFQINGTNHFSSSVSVSGSTVIVKLTTATVKSGDEVKISYRANDHDSTKWLKDASGFIIENLGHHAVTNNTQAAVEYAEVAGDSLVLTYDGPLDDTQVPAASAYSVTVGSGTAAAPSAVAVDGRNLELTLSSAVTVTDKVKVTYTKPSTNPLRGGNRFEVLAFTDQVADNTSRLLVRNSRRTASPGAWSHDYAAGFTTGSSAFKLTRVDLWLGKASSATDTGQWAVRISEANANGRPGTSLGTLTTSTAVGVNEFVRVEHAASGDGILLAADTAYYVEFDVSVGGLHLIERTTSNDEEAGAAPGWSLADRAISRASLATEWPPTGSEGFTLKTAIHGYSTDNTAPTLSTAKVNGTALTLTYDETLDPNSTPALTAFSVRVDSGTAVNPTAVEVTGSTVILTLGTAVTSGQTVTLTYSPGTGIPIRDVAAPHYNKAGTLNAKTVSNISGTGTIPEVTAVAITSNPGADMTYAAGDTISVGVTFDEAVNVVTSGGSPRLQIKLHPNFGELWAVYSSGHGTATLTFDYTVASPNASTQGIAVLQDTLELNGGTISATGDGSTAALTHQGLAHNSGHLVDARAPQLVFAAVKGSTLTLTFNESLDENSQPAGLSFNVSAKGTGGQTSLIPGANTATVEGATVKVGLSYAPNQGDTLTVAYALPASGKLRDVFGNEVAAFSSRQTANNSGDAQASISLVSNTGQPDPSGDIFTTIFDYAPSFTTGSATDGYMLTSVQIDFLAGTAAPTYSVEIRNQSGGVPGSTLLGTLNKPTALVDGLNLFEASGTGIQLAASTTYYVVVDVATSGTGTTLRDTISDGEDAGGAPGWSLSDNTQHRSTTDTTWATPASNARSVRLSVQGYPRGAPTLSSTTVTGAKVTLAYDRALDTTSTPDKDDFEVKVDTNKVSLASTNPVVVSGSAVTLTLAAAVTPGQSVTVKYTPGTNPIRGANGGAAAVTLPERTVVNETPVTPPPGTPVTPPPGTPVTPPPSDGTSLPSREPVPLQLALWTDEAAYRAGETVRLYYTIHPHDDREQYRVFVWLEPVEGEGRRYLAPLSGDGALHPEAVDIHGLPEHASRTRLLPRADKALAFEGEAPELGLWRFVLELRPEADEDPDDQVEEVEEPLESRQAWANFTVAERGQLLNRRGFDREVRSDATLRSDTIYHLLHQLFVHDGATLTIEPGTVVRAWGRNTAIIVEPGGRIVAEGTREAPVVLTCSAPVGQRYPGCWGGLRILGKGPVTRLEGVAPGVLPPERPVYGGTDAEDSSGVLRHVRVEFAGASGDPEEPGPAIGLYGAGSGTILDRVQARASLGDGFAFSGGTAACDHCVASGSGNAGLSWERGWRGGATHLYVQHGQGGVDGLAGANDDQGYDLEPRSLPTLSNVTLIHALPYGNRERRGVALRLSTGSGVRISELLSTRFGGGAIDARGRSALLFHEGESSVTGALLWRNGRPLLREGIQDVVDFIAHRDSKLHDVRDFANPDPRPKADSPALHEEGEGYIGAFGRKENWLEEWTVFGPESVYDLREPDE